MRMCGTVKCRPTLAYRVHFDSINISHCTDYKILLQLEKMLKVDIFNSFQ